MDNASKLVRERMTNTKFVPQGNDTNQRSTHAAEYIAFYLGEIDGHLSTIAAHLQTGTANSAKIAQSLHGLQTVLPGLFRDLGEKK